MIANQPPRTMVPMVSVAAADCKVVVAEIDAAAAAVAGCYDQLPGPARAAMIKLGHGLSRLRRRLAVEAEAK